jgi:multiple sugar transport system permease protein
LTVNRDHLENILIGKVLRWIGLVFFFLICVFPFYYMLLLSFREIQSVVVRPGSLLPDWELITSLRTYREVLGPVARGGQGFGSFIRNSLIVALITTLLTLAVAVFAAYAATRLRFRGKAAANWGLLLVYMIPGIVLSIPLYVMYSRLGFRSTVPTRLFALIVVYLAFTLPVALYMLRSYFQTIPIDLEEAALIDGSSRLGTIRHVILPLAVPAVAATGLYVFMIAWNEFLFALLFMLEKREAWTLPLGLAQLDTQEVPKTVLMAGSVIITLPVVLLFTFFERYITTGLTAGGVKG